MSVCMHMSSGACEAPDVGAGNSTPADCNLSSLSGPLLLSFPSLPLAPKVGAGDQILGLCRQGKH